MLFTDRFRQSRFLKFVFSYYVIAIPTAERLSSSRVISNFYPSNLFILPNRFGHSDLNFDYARFPLHGFLRDVAYAFIFHSLLAFRFAHKSYGTARLKRYVFNTKHFNRNATKTEFSRCFMFNRFSSYRVQFVLYWTSRFYALAISEVQRFTRGKYY